MFSHSQDPFSEYQDRYRFQELGPDIFESHYSGYCTPILVYNIIYNITMSYNIIQKIFLTS